MSLSPTTDHRTKATEFAFNAKHIFIPKRTLELIYFPPISRYGRRFEDQRCSCLTVSVIVFQMASRHLLDMENKGYSGALGGNGNFTGFLDASNSVAVNSNESSGLH